MSIVAPTPVKMFLIFAFLALIGFSSSHVSKIAFLWAFFVFFAGMLYVTFTNNRHGMAHLLAGYIMATEVFYRMAWAGVPWEFAKYAILLLLINGMIFGRNKHRYSLLIVFYLLLHIPAIYLSFEYYGADTLQLKKRLFFNLLGPLVLGVSAMYFYRFKMTLEEFSELSRWIVLGVFTMGVLVIFNVGDYTAVQFSYSSNMSSSGGFSGNQVAIAFGVGIIIMMVNMIMKNRLFIYIWVDLLLLFMFIFQGLMTFSRGGVLGAVLAAGLGSLVYYFSNFEQLIEFFRKNIIKVVLAIVFATGTFSYVNEITDGYLYSRYFNVDKDGNKIKEDLSTGRGDIVLGDLMLFEDSFYTGVGAGVSVEVRPLHRGFAPHVEFSRLLAEHGMLGFFAIIILLFLPVSQFFYLAGNPRGQFILVAFVLLTFISMTHAATRVAMIGFFYGMSFLLIYGEEKDEV